MILTHSYVGLRRRLMFVYLYTNVFVRDYQRRSPTSSRPTGRCKFSGRPLGKRIAASWSLQACCLSLFRETAGDLFLSCHEKITFTVIANAPNTIHNNQFEKHLHYRLSQNVVCQTFSLVSFLLEIMVLDSASNIWYNLLRARFAKRVCMRIVTKKDKLKYKKQRKLNWNLVERFVKVYYYVWW